MSEIVQGDIRIFRDENTKDKPYTYVQAIVGAKAKRSVDDRGARTYR